MKLTPVKVRGKGPRKKGWRPPDPGRFKRALGEARRSREKKNKKKKPAAPIERLPAEILEQILFMSENLNLPRSSLRIGRLLSGRSFLSELAVAAFGPTWDLWFGCVRSQIRSYRDYEADYHRVGGNPEFQSAVLACPRMSLALLLDAQKKWYRRHGEGRHYQHADTLDEYRYMDRDGGSRAGGRPDQLELRDRLIRHGRGGFGHACDLEACLGSDWEWFEKPQFIRLVDCDRDWRRQRYIDLHPATRIPDHLLADPMDCDRIKWLFWLIRGGAALSRHQTWEITECGYQKAMDGAESSPELALLVIRLFFALGVFSHRHWPKFLVSKKLSEAHGECDDDNSTVTANYKVWKYVALVLKNIRD
ncbi:hypothetical protein B0T24DRAFT_634552 [Lasiosphaeria ovina]|uniref:F-box domain-containing protein n=1 Tax=Lasiosphaeria ovina TaxID=92902 RepID=A0AAE0JZU0_9PEZI|nr:hypothetical protein B0T24DRAFT_634552 [Lasiosphaeria ovina]